MQEVKKLQSLNSFYYPFLNAFSTLLDYSVFLCCGHILIYVGLVSKRLLKKNAPCTAPCTVLLRYKTFRSGIV